MSDNNNLSKHNTFRVLCIQNAKDNIRAAKLLKDQNVNHLVFHLSILALEEIGKIFMAFIKLSQKEKWDTHPLKVPLDDHVKKIFYAIWGPSIGAEIIDKKQWEDHHSEATKLHEIRLKTLYSDLDDEVSSAQKLDNEFTNQVLSFAEARLNLAEIDGDIDVDAPVNPNFLWFEEMSDKKENHNFFWGKIAQEKLIELNSFDEWLAWLKQTKEEENKKSIDLGIQEINRVLPENIEDIKPKWEMGFTLVSRSHSIRPKDLSAFNKIEKFLVKLFPGKDKHTLKITLTIGNNVSITELFHFGFSMCKLFTASLNIATNGIFYWNFKTDHTKYYDKIVELGKLENPEVRLEDKSLDWKAKNLYLTEQNMIVSSIVYEYFLTITTKEEVMAIQEYLQALSTLAKSDIHLNLDNLSFNHFYNSYKVSVLANQIDATNENFATIGFNQIEKMKIAKQDYDQVLELGITLEKATVIDRPISQSELLMIKSISEKYFLTLACRRQHKDKELCLTLEET